MKKIIMLMIGVVALCIADVAVATEPTQANVIAVKGCAELKVEPDIFFLNFTLQGDSRPIIDQRRDVLELLKSAKIDLDKQLSINSMGTTSRRASNGNYETIPTQSFTLRLFSTQQLQLISSALEKKGIKNQRVNIDTSKRDEYERQVRVLAMQDAREQAQILAEAVGCKAGQCMKIIDPSNRSALKSHGANMNASRVHYSEFAEESELTASPNLKYEKIEISYSVEAEFVLESGK